MSTPNTIARKQEELCAKLERSGSLRQLLIDEGFKYLTIADLSRFLRGEEPKNYNKRKELGLDTLAPAPVCPVCGIVHAKVCHLPFKDRCKDPKIIAMYNYLSFLKKRNEH